MTVDITIAPGQVESTCRRQIAQYTGPSSYAAGGDPVVPAVVRMGKVFAVLGGLITNGTLVRLVTYNPTTGKLFITIPDTGAEVAPGQNLSGYSGRLEFVGQ